MMSFAGQRTIDKVRKYPMDAEKKIREARLMIKRRKDVGADSVIACMHGAKELVDMTEALFDYFLERENLWI